jgi:hypothetical protein
MKSKQPYYIMTDKPWFRYVKRYLMEEYPFIIDVEPEPNYMDYETLYFIRPIIDKNKLSDYGGELKDRINSKVIPFLSYEVSNGELIEEDIMKTLRRLSSGLPDNIKPDRTISVGSFYNPKGTF